MSIQNNYNNGLIIIHHSAVFWGWNLESINQWHKERFYDVQINKQPIWMIKWVETKYQYIAYHYIIDKGVIYQNRDIWQIWYHAGDWWTNTASIAICLNGNYEKEEVNAEDWNALQILLNDIRGIIKITDIKGHRDIKNTLCPWINLYKRIEILKNLYLWTNKMGQYETIFKEEFWYKSSIYTDIEGCIYNTKIDRETFFMLLIWMERSKKS